MVKPAGAVCAAPETGDVSAPPQGTDYFFRRHPLTPWQVRASLCVRRQVYDWFAARVGGVRGKTFLEHGATPDTERGDSNCFIRWLLADGAHVYAASPEDIRGLTAAFPGLRTLPWPLGNADFADVQYVISSAVLEHAGPAAQQKTYLAALLRARRPLLLTTPNRRHWLEFHTKLPLLHWLPKRVHRRLLSLLGFRAWAREEHLNLVTAAELTQLLDAASQTTGVGLRLTWHRPVFLGMVSNLVVLVEPEPA